MISLSNRKDENMDKNNISQDLIKIQGNSTIPYNTLIKFADDSSLLDLYIERYGIKFYQQCIFSLTHISISEHFSEKMWIKIVNHRIELNSILKRDIGLKVAAMDYLENFSEGLYNMTSFEVDKIDDIVDAAIIDKLTSLYVRRIFDVIFEIEFQLFLRNSSPLSLMMIDIDDFKYFNDTYGHQEGDEALRIIGKVLLHAIRSYDTACRYGGEELIVIMPQTNLDTAVSTAKRICKKIASTDINGKSITVSVGVSEATKSVIYPAELLKQTDEALYKAKSKGKNQVVFI